MTIIKVAAGVFLGNLAFALLSFLILSALFDSARRDALYQHIDAQYDAIPKGQQR